MNPEKPSPAPEAAPSPKISTREKILFLIGLVLLVFCAMNVMIALGFLERHGSTAPPRWMGTEWVWIVNGACGIIAVVLMQPRKPFRMAIVGLVAGAGITGFSYLYLFWRTSMINYEVMVMLIVGALPAIAVHGLLNKLLDRK